MRIAVFFGLIIFLVASIGQFGIAEGSKPSFAENKSYFIFSPDNRYLVKVFQTSNSTWVRVHDTDEMKMLTQWQIPNFKAHTTRFSLKDPSKLLIADKKRLLVYRLIGNRKKLLFMQPKIKGQEIVQAFFNKETDDIVWATKSTVYKTDSKKNEQKEVLRVPWGEGEIKSVAASGKQDLAVNLEKSKKILLLSPNNNFKPIELRGHQKPVVGLQPIEREQLVSLDSDYQLVIWNMVTRDVKKKITLKKPSEEAQALGFSVDDPEDYLSVVSRTKGKTIGQRYKLSDLKKGQVKPESMPMTITSSGNVYASGNTLPGKSEEKILIEKEPVVSWQPSQPKKKKNTLYDLAKIEAENGEYQAALELIKKISLDDPEYGESRILKRKVFDAINDQNIATAAREQMNKGNYKSAKILLENALSKNPDSSLLSQQLRQVEDKLDDKTWLKMIILLLLALLVAALGYALWRYQKVSAHGSANKTSKPFKASKIFGFGGIERPKNDEKKDIRHRFVYKLDETRRLLNQAASKDIDRRFKNTWMEITARLNTIEKRAKLSDKFLNDFLSELETVQKSIKTLGNQGEKKPGFQFEEESGPKSNQSRKEKTQKKRSQNTQKKTKDVKEPNYYSILGVSKNATLDDVKKAYRRKMKDYHPDRHNSSDFSWVKEEADKRTKQVQEAYLKLSELLK